MAPPRARSDIPGRARFCVLDARYRARYATGMSAKLLIPATTLSGAGDATGTARLPQVAPGTSVAVQVDTDGTLVLGDVVIELRNTHPDAVNSGGGWIDYSAEIAAVGDDLTAGQGTAGYNFSLQGYEEIRVTASWASGSGDVSVVVHSVT